jgi:hypothetical protein
MKNKLIFSGCSYSQAGTDTHPHSNWTSLMKKIHGYDVHQLAVSGQSNESITKKVYDFVIKHNPKDCLIICQLTYTHRIGWWHSIANQWSDYQPNYINVIPDIDEETDKVTFVHTLDIRDENPTVMFPKGNVTKKQYDELINMYLTWLTYVYDEDEMFKYLLYRTDTLKSYVEQSGNKILFVYWPDIKNEFQLKELKKRNFFSIDSDYSILKWSTKNKLVDHTSHLSHTGNIDFSNALNLYLENDNSIKLNKISTLI